ncbi:MAG: cob(I)yrinic acid a,c-diamide adenosyltransferase [Candidatus Eremiobacteraeota bacterium]|nr:cob(I)yrinic acid a,c-diamide adenosyltransferase [Candidatus Eremiobacteraeota bacterium]MCW5872036.1 cob(I)yrinic acid a,c-diamide adenosyltransferase [Candidatus Eremiobacteraeota bacterium]
MRINRVVTRTGDGGQTALIGGERISKSSLRVDSYGEVDELNSCLGLAAAWLQDTQALELLQLVQHRLFTLGADLAAPEGVSVPRMLAGHVEELEQAMEPLMGELPPLEEFILPGGGPAGAALHLARTVARRAERSTVALASHEPVNEQAIIYLNRLSDFLFVLARVVNKRQSQPEKLADFSQKKARKSR